MKAHAQASRLNPTEAELRPAPFTALIREAMDGRIVHANEQAEQAKNLAVWLLGAERVRRLEDEQLETSGPGPSEGFFADQLAGLEVLRHHQQRLGAYLALVARELV